MATIPDNLRLDQLRLKAIDRRVFNDYPGCVLTRDGDFNFVPLVPKYSPSVLTTKASISSSGIFTGLSSGTTQPSTPSNSGGSQGSGGGVTSGSGSGSGSGVFNSIGLEWHKMNTVAIHHDLVPVNTIKRYVINELFENEHSILHMVIVAEDTITFGIAGSEITTVLLVKGATIDIIKDVRYEARDKEFIENSNQYLVSVCLTNNGTAYHSFTIGGNVNINITTPANKKCDVCYSLIERAKEIDY